jgi:hypothetical protein
MKVRYRLYRSVGRGRLAAFLFALLGAAHGSALKGGHCEG